jgi:hypothetical protein
VRNGNGTVRRSRRWFDEEKRKIGRERMGSKEWKQRRGTKWEEWEKMKKEG